LGITTIYVTHDQEEALTLSDRIALMEKGVCQQIGTPHEIYNHPANAFVASFMGRSNIMRGTIAESKTDRQPALIVDVEGGIQLHISDSELERSGNINLSVRPETIILRKNDEGRGNTFQGEVKLKQFNGYMVEYEVDVRGISFNVIALNEEDRVFDIHEKVYVEIPANKISIIPGL
jgi:iron(III) transport system ATP-binding protein